MAQRKAFAVAALAASLVAACSGSGGGGGGTTTAPPPAPAAVPGLVSGPSPFAVACGGAGGTLYLNAEVEPHLAVSPRDANHLIGVWQQDRWSNGSARGNATAVSFDGGATWSRRLAPLSACSGGTAANGGDFERATDPWVTIALDGTAYQMSLSTSGASFAPGSANAMLVSRSTDGGLTWSAPVALIRDTAPYFNDKNAITADPTDSRYVYAVWDRLEQGRGGPTFLARTTDGGLNWEPARTIFDPGPSAQTIGNLVAVRGDGTALNLFTQLTTSGGAPDGTGATVTGHLAVLRSTDKGASWSAPVRIAELLAIGVVDPETGVGIRGAPIVAQIAAAADGAFVVVWSDARFSGGARDAIAFARSTDGGASWSAPVRVNPDASVPAFTPQVRVRADGMIGVTYFDLRSNTADPATLGADYWIARSADGVNWSETRVAGPFNLNTAPNAGGYFLGDYMGLGAAGTAFLPFYTRTTGDLANRTDVFLARIAAAPGLAEADRDPKRALAQESRLETYRAEPAPEGFVASDALRQKVSDNIVRAMKARIPNWTPPRR